MPNTDDAADASASVEYVTALVTAMLAEDLGAVVTTLDAAEEDDRLRMRDLVLTAVHLATLLLTEEANEAGVDPRDRWATILQRALSEG